MPIARGILSKVSVSNSESGRSSGTLLLFPSRVNKCLVRGPSSVIGLKHMYFHILSISFSEISSWEIFSQFGINSSSFQQVSGVSVDTRTAMIVKR